MKAKYKRDKAKKANQSNEANQSNDANKADDTSKVDDENAFNEKILSRTRLQIQVDILSGSTVHHCRLVAIYDPALTKKKQELSTKAQEKKD
ncbi:hypothetical protein N7519_005375 [Penicillium mononematosum]|uniref:uncharacterized protein n=1 Tax=Penicillium mononematosum TaxID=268346 RepID=UPI00254889D2|nr:uncharacterized protein N7519_005375 [Penicillium mononematosum]KAJ6184074.1 hypothetical protein N7519_005375 [Penicillium mononematosum]